MRLLVDPRIAGWVADRIDQMGGAEDFGPCQAFGVVSDDKVLGGVVFNNWIPRYRSIEVSFASGSARWLSRRIITQILSYPFDQLDCERVTALTPSRTASARRFLDNFGFVREGIVRMGFGDDDAVISGLLRDEWRQSRWNVGAHGKVHPETAPSTGPGSDGERAGLGQCPDRAA